jgi:hypothetical protein
MIVPTVAASVPAQSIIPVDLSKNIFAVMPRLQNLTARPRHKRKMKSWKVI